MIRFSLLGSGSKGNALFVSSPHASILIDAGLSLKVISERLASLGESAASIRAVFVSHEHHDHVSGLGPVARKLGVPVYMTRGTKEQLPASAGTIPNVVLFEAGDELEVEGLRVGSYSVSHDAADPVGFVVHANGVKLGVASDLGHVSHLVKMRLKGSHALVLEANHCPDMLIQGPYPAHLKQRIRGRQGHLSNLDMKSLLEGLIHDKLRLVVLAHVSQENNTLALAHRLANEVVQAYPIEVVVARQDRPTRLFEVSG